MARRSPRRKRSFAARPVVSGLGVALVVRTGGATEFGHVAAQLARRAPATEFERGTRQFGILIAQIVLALTVFVFFVNALFHRDPLESFLFAVALAVGLTPELFPMIVSGTLTRGAVRMAARKVIVKRLAAIENFGSMDILCSDKTGTLTRGEMTLGCHVNCRNEEDEEVIRLAALNATHQTGLRSPMDDTLLRHQHPDVARATRIDEVPFDFERRRVPPARRWPWPARQSRSTTSYARTSTHSSRASAPTATAFSGWPRGPSRHARPTVARTSAS
jgi:Mg2+-importing ATPase